MSVVRDFINQNSRKNDIKLFFNEFNKDAFKNLKYLIESQCISFATLSNNEVNPFITSYIKKYETIKKHSLWFVDPFGYTQINPDTFKKLFNLEKCDYLLFVPITSIHRFKSDKDCKSVKTFFDVLSIKQFETNNLTRDQLAELIITKIKKIADADYGYKFKLETDTGSHYYLFFICRHILGAEKFLQSQKQVSKFGQQLIFDPALLEASNIFNLIKGRSHTNVELYKLSIRSGILPEDMNKVLRCYEKQGKIHVKSLPGKTRNRNGFYISYKYFKTDDARIIIKA